MSGGAFCRTELFTSKFPICGSTLLLTQWERKKDAAEWFADLAQETLGGEVWRTAARSYGRRWRGDLVGHALHELRAQAAGTLYKQPCGGGWLDDEDAVGRSPSSPSGSPRTGWWSSRATARDRSAAPHGAASQRKRVSVTSSRRSCAGSWATGRACTSAPTACSPARAAAAARRCEDHAPRALLRAGRRLRARTRSCGSASKRCAFST